MTGRSSGVDRRDSGSADSSQHRVHGGAFPSPQSAGLATTSPDAGPSRRGAPPPPSRPRSRALAARGPPSAPDARRGSGARRATPRRKDALARLLDPVAVVTVAGDHVVEMTATACPASAPLARRPARSPDRIGALAPPSRVVPSREPVSGGGAPSAAATTPSSDARPRAPDATTSPRCAISARATPRARPGTSSRSPRNPPPPRPPPPPPAARANLPVAYVAGGARPPPSSRLWAAPGSCAPSAASPRRRISARPSPSPRARRR